MKTFNKIFLTLGVAASAFGLSSCVGDLDMQPVDPSEITDVSNNMDEVFADIYLNFATSGANGNSPVHTLDDGGMATFGRAMFTAEEMPTDEACWLWDPEKFGRINYGYVTPDLPIVKGIYARLLINIALCNDFITSVRGGKFNLDDAGQARAEEYVRQARILRGACYYYVLSFYENPPYADETTPIGADPEQPGRAQVYANVTSDLEDVVAYYKANPTTTYYGFVGLDAAESILAKIYLNGMVFAGRDDYAKCYEHSKAVIDRLGVGGKYGNGLAPTYAALFGANNSKYCIGNAGDAVSEIIWTIPASKENVDGNITENLTTWAGSTFMIAAWNGANGVFATVPCPTTNAAYKNAKPEDLLFTDADGVQHIYKYFESADDAYNEAKASYDEAAGGDTWKITVAKFFNGVAYSFDPKEAAHTTGEWINATESWKCMVARKSFVRKFDWNDVEMSKSDDSRVANWRTSEYGFTAENPSLVGDDWGKNGYLAMKYTNWIYDANGEIDFKASENVPMTACYGGDFVALRLAEVYLMAAEAILQGGGGSQAEALKYVNYLRQRAYGDKYTPWASLSMSELQDERCRELYTENNRRTDLIRWNKWCTGYTWEWKGGVASGTNLPEYTKSFPLPSGVMTTTNLQQQKGY
ncbi:MAG: RagB/SusD family nutrient uptake outer membrane protein [Bacteroidales bacterium]|nr:RagB/SusD family nutrient uptake outer membrane protein [Bacteroidales bacterium]MBD5204852.1 RagB/SusD family nutrient uptake outer membrane protein [Bacteroidales bacterium]MBD5223095.1 RagB/SusD family nutrient uptake outer membrane protein [Bacteroidales bacterium]